MSNILTFYTKYAPSMLKAIAHREKRRSKLSLRSSITQTKLDVALILSDNTAAGIDRGRHVSLRLNKTHEKDIGA